MTVRQVYEAVLTEVNKVSAPCFLLLDFNYFLRKSINLYINKRYNIYDTSLLTTDDLRVLKATTILDATEVTDENITNTLGTIFRVTLPSDYLHMLNCVCVYKVDASGCSNGIIRKGARKITSDLWAHLGDNYYLKPTYKLPYFCINNINTNETNPTNPYKSDTKLGTDITSIDIKEGKITIIGGLPTLMSIGNDPNDPKSIDVRNRLSEVRYGNASTVTLEIRCGTLPTSYTLYKVGIDYLKSPLWIDLTTTEIDSVVDSSQIMEFPDYVCQEIINELTMLFLENFSDPRLQTNIPVTQSIVQAQQQTN